MDLVIHEAQNLGVSCKEVSKVKSRRLKEIESNIQLKQYYKNHGIVTGKEPIKVDISLIGFDLSKEIEEDRFTKENDGTPSKMYSLKKIIEDVVDEINKLIQKTPGNMSVKGQRYFVLNTNHEPFSKYNSLGLPEKFVITDEEDKQRWLHRVIQALVDKGYLFKLDKVNGHG